MIVTATTSEGTLSPEVRNAAQNAPTALFFMGFNKLGEIIHEYKSAGKSDLPAAVIGAWLFTR